MNFSHYPKTVERWGMQEIVCPGREDGNPFADYEMHAEFTSQRETVRVMGFYDGDGRWVVRFMPSYEGAYTFRVWGSFSDTAYEGAFEAVAAGAGNHGPVGVSGQYHFAYADGTRYIPVGTTCYVWQLQSDALFEQTIRTLEASPFNKIRFCVFPKHYDYNLGEPYSYPYEGTPCDSSWLTRDNFGQADAHTKGNQWDFARFNPAHFRRLEQAIIRLQKIGVEADIIVLHPYDRWGFSVMTREQDCFYADYLSRRISAMRNVWWSLANEYDLLQHKTMEDWAAVAAAIMAQDPYRHLMSNHNCYPFFDHSQPFITHCCLQRQDIYRTTEYVDEWRARWGKPVIVDEMGYEGNIQHGWGNLSGEEIVRRFWEAAMRGGYGGHGETYLHPQNVLWWSHGGELHGDAPARLAFLRRILEALPGLLQRAKGRWDDVTAIPEGDDPAAPGLLMHYYSFMRPSFREFVMPEGVSYRVEVIDTWNMTREDRGVYSGRFRVELPGRSYMAICLRREG